MEIGKIEGSFKPIIPYMARRKKTRQLSDWAADKVQVSFTGLRGYGRIRIWIGVEMCSGLGWEAGEKMAVSMDEKGKAFLIKKAEAPMQGFTLQAGKYSRSISFPFKLTHKFKRKIVDFKMVDDEILIVRLKNIKRVKNEK